MRKIFPFENEQPGKKFKQEKFDEETRFYYIRVKDIRNLSQELLTSKTQFSSKFALSFEISTKKSQTTFSIYFGKVAEINTKRLRQESHFFSFSGEEIMIVKLHQVGNKKIKGYSQILLTPFISMPHTRHELTVKMVFQNNENLITNQISAILQLDLYFLLNFKAQLQIIPTEGRITRNTSNFGLMKPCLIFTLNKQRKKSLVVKDGGIHPDWADFANKRKKQLLQVGYQEDSDFVKDQAVQNSFTFDMSSIGHELKIQLISYPLIGQDVVLVGSKIIKLESMGFFLNPNEIQSFNDKKSIKLTYMDPETKTQKEAGKISIKSKFIYDIMSIRKEIDSDDSESNDQ